MRLMVAILQLTQSILVFRFSFIVKRALCGCELRSIRPNSPSVLTRWSNLRTVRGLMPAASANSLNHQFAPRKRRAGILMAVYPVSPLWVLKCSEPQFPRTFRVNKSLKRYT